MTEYTFEYVVAGRNFGPMPWRDPADPTYAYHIREANVLSLSDPDGFEAVKVNLTTGVNTQLQFWARTSNYDDYGACFTDPLDIGSSSNICGSIAGTKLYQFAQSGNELADNCNNVIIELNKSDMSISKSFMSSTGTNQRDSGVAVCNAAGTLVARAGDVAANDGSVIELYRPSDDAYGYVNLKTVLAINGCVGLHYAHQAPIAFDDGGFLWVIEQPFAAERQNDESVLHKLSVTNPGAGVLSLSLEGSYTIPDEHYAWGSSSGGLFDFADDYGHKRFVFDHSALKFYLWSAWDSLSGTTEGWFFEINTSGAITRGPLDWTPPPFGDLGGFIKLDSRGFSTAGKFAVISLRSGFDYDVSIFDIASGTETQHDLAGFPNDIVDEGNYDGNGMNLWHTTDGGNSYIYAFDVRRERITGGWDECQDGIFSILDDVDPEAEAVGGSGAQMEPVGIVFELYPIALTQSAMNSCIELGPFRFAEQKQADETALISSLILGISQEAIGVVVFEDYNTIENDTDDEDWNEEVDQDGDDIYEDWGEGSGDSDDFELELMSTDDGISPQFQRPEVLDVIEDFGSSKQYVPVGYSAIFHRLKLCANEVNQYWAVKTIDIAGVLTGRHL